MVMGKQENRRLLTDTNLEWEAKYVESKVAPQRQFLLKRVFSAAENIIDTLTHPRTVRSVTDILQCVRHLVHDDSIDRKVVVIGCGPRPETIRELASMGFNVIGVEPVGEAVRQASNYLEGIAKVVKGTAEQIPLPDGAQTLVLMESVLEHVDSASKSLAEAYRILKPGGVLFIRTTNRTRFSLTGVNWEYRVRFFNWLPRMVQESYIFNQLHYHPELASYSSRPAVHWFTFPDLCNRGRDVGFARFYSPYDLLNLSKCQDNPGLGSKIRCWLHRRPWLRALIVSQMTGDIFMWKRVD